MADKPQKTPEELTALVAQGVDAVKSAVARNTELETENAQLNEEKQARQAQIDEAVAYGPKIVDILIKSGTYKEADRETALAAMANPVKVAQELGNLLTLSANVPSVGIPEGEESEKTAGEKTAGENPMAEADDRYLQSCGLS